jgi:hypothetical protein
LTSKTPPRGGRGGTPGRAMLVARRSARGVIGMEHGDQVRLLAALCRELAILGLDVGMSDARPAVSVRRSRGDPRLWISVDIQDGCFSWREGHHAVDDAAGAAGRIATDVRRSS